MESTLLGINSTSVHHDTEYNHIYSPVSVHDCVCLLAPQRTRHAERRITALMMITVTHNTQKFQEKKVRKKCEYFSDIHFL